MAQDNNDIMKKLNDSFNDFVKNVFGDSGVQFIEDTNKQVKEFSATAIKGFVDFGDQMIDSLKLNENELVKKSSDQVKDLLKQVGLLEDDTEDDF